MINPRYRGLHFGYITYGRSLQKTLAQKSITTRQDGSVLILLRPMKNAS